LKYERVDVGGPFGGNDQQRYLDMNPNGVVPTVEDEGRILWESNTILRYLAAKYAPGTLWPTDAGERSEAERWMDWQLSTLHTGMRAIYWGLVRTPAEKREMQAITATAANIGKLWGRLDLALVGRPYVAGSHFTVGDIAVGYWVHSWFALTLQRPEVPSVSTWYERLRTRTAYDRQCRNRAFRLKMTLFQLLKDILKAQGISRDTGGTQQEEFRGRLAPFETLFGRGDGKPVEPMGNCASHNGSAAKMSEASERHTVFVDARFIHSAKLRVPLQREAMSVTGSRGWIANSAMRAWPQQIPTGHFPAPLAFLRLSPSLARTGCETQQRRDASRAMLSC
jgi:glutathione S-transferase